jgi:RNA polymerase sigma-70 factor (ECF subfamily)
MDTTQLLELCQKGDAEAIEKLVNDYYSRIVRLALSILEDSAEAEEAAQEVFLIVLKALDSYRAEATFTTWLYRITVNVCRNSLRKRRARERLVKTLHTLWPFIRESEMSPEDATVINETETLVRQAVNALGEKHRIPIILFYYHGFSTSEIASILDLHEGTVHSRLSIARDRLRAKLHLKLINPSGSGKDVKP